MKRKIRGRSERALDTTFAVTLFSLTGLKLTGRIGYAGEWSNVDQILLLARPSLGSLSGDYCSTSVPLFYLFI